MSAAPNLPPNNREFDQVPPTQRRSHWKRALIWTGAGIGILVLLVIAAVLVLLHNGSAHRKILQVAQEQASGAIGSDVKIRDYRLGFSGLSPKIDLQDVVINGAEPYSTVPLLTADRLFASIKVTSLLRRTWYLEEVRVEHPVVRVVVDKQGRNNLPKTKDDQQQSQTDIFDLGVRHAAIIGGEVYYNDEQSALEADLHELNFRSNFATGEQKYSGTLSYRDGHLKLSNFRPMPHDLDARFDATPSTFTLERAVLRSGQSQFVINATLENYDNPTVQAEYQATLHADEFGRILRNPALPSGIIRARGNLSYADEANRPFLEGLKVSGDLASRVLQVRVPSFQGEISDIHADYRLSNGNVEVRNLRASVLGGELTGIMVMRNLTGATRSRLQAELSDVSLAQVKSQVTSPALREVILSGKLDATVDASWGKSLDDLIARGDATVNANMTPASATAAAPVPLNGVVHAKYSAPSGEITLSRSYLRTAQTTLNLNGTVSRRSALDIRFQANDLKELDTIASQFRPGEPPLGLSGRASFTGSVTGSTAAPRVIGQLRASDLRMKESAWRVLQTDVDLSPSRVSLQNGELVPAQRGRIAFSLTAGLRDWSFMPSSQVQASLRASQLNLAEFARAAGVQAQVAGTLSADVDVRGSQLNPVGDGTVRLTNARIANQPIQSANINFSGNGDSVNANVEIRSPAGPVNAVLSYQPKQRSYDAQLQATGIRLEQLEAIKQQNLDLTGVLNLVASGRGTIDNPGLTATLEVPRLDIRDQTISGLILRAALSNQVANFTLDSKVMNTAVQGRGTVNLTGDYYAEASLDTQIIPLARLVAAYAPSQAGSIKGETEVHATLRGPLKNAAALEAHVTIPKLAVSYRDAVQIGAVRPIRIDYTNGVLELQRAALRGTGTDLEFQGTVPVVTKAPPSLLVLGTVDLRVAELLNPDVSSSGQVRFNINSYGARNPDVQGQIEIKNASFATGTMPLGLQHGNGVLTLTSNRLNITKFTGNVAGGEVSASGGVVYRPTLQMNLAVNGRDMRVLYNNVRAGLDAELVLAGTADKALLSGQVGVDQLQFTSQFELADVMRTVGGGTSTPPPTGGFSNALALDVAVQSTSGINTVSRTLSLQAAANLRVVGTAAQPVVLGRVNINGGDLIFMGNRYVLQGGTVDFVNASRTEPVVNVSVNTTIEQYDIQMRFWGPVNQLHTNYSSNPALPPSDIINLVAFGKTQESAAANPTAPGNFGAQALIASQVSSQVTSRLSKVAGISQLAIDPLRGCDQQSGGTGACITVQQRVTSKMFVTFSADVTNTQRTTVQLEYRATPRLSFSGSRDQNGGFGFDTRIHREW
ncbi:MAG TPA: translocation/assembly module TamB domain-containing protein [Terriglobales bacterium]|nr:translocation/assembly module TamB domain-containing protein [Terriglobales bacterium]